MKACQQDQNHKGKLGCTRIPTSSCCSSEKKKDFCNKFLVSEYFAESFNRPFDKI